MRRNSPTSRYSGPTNSTPSASKTSSSDVHCTLSLVSTFLPVTASRRVSERPESLSVSPAFLWASGG